MGILKTDRIIIYCSIDLISSCRAWFQFLYFGHEPKLVSVLNGGMKKWKLEGRKVTNIKNKITSSKYTAKENKNMIKIKSQIDQNIKKKEFTILDARSKNRFLGLENEPRPSLRSGSIENSQCLPFNELINSNNKTFIKKKLIKEKFKEMGIEKEINVVFSCGSGITAAVLALAYSLINDKYLPTVYDGSWAEYGKIK